MKVARAGRWVLEGLAVAAFAAGAFALPWLWVTLFPPPGPYTLPATHRIQPRLPRPEPLKASGRAVLTMRMRPPSPLPDEKLIFVDLRSRPQTLTAYEGIRAVYQYPISGSRLGTDDVGPCRIRAKSRRHWYEPEEYWMEWWMTLEPLTPEGRARAKIRGLNGIHATAPSNYRRLGRPASHGCIRMRRQDARELWAWADPGTQVYLYKYRRQRSSLPALLEKARQLARE